MVWLGLVVLVAVIALVLFLMARRRDGAGDRDLGTISGSWLNERRAHDRDVDPNR
jgi:hypothetical protein